MEKVSQGLAVVEWFMDWRSMIFIWIEYFIC